MKNQPKLVVIGKENKYKVFQENHCFSSGLHLGYNKTLQKIGSQYYWAGFSRDVREWVSKS